MSIPGYLARVLHGSDGPPVGTCFQIDTGVLVTAAHVLTEIGADTQGSVVVFEALNAGGCVASATVRRVDLLHDLAVLTTAHPLPATVVAVQDTDRQEPGGSVRVTGFAQVPGVVEAYRYLDVLGTWSPGTTREDGTSWGRVSCQDVMRGMSGAPVRRAGDDTVIGVVSGRYNGADGWLRDTVWIARIEDLTQHLEGLTPVRPRPAAASPETFDYDVRQDGLFPLGVWSPARKLEPSRLITEILPADNRPMQPYLDPKAFAAAVEARSRTSSGATVYLTGFRIDHRESDDTQYCRIYQAPSIYPEVLAIEDLRIERPELFEDCDQAIERDVRDYLRMAVPSSLAVNLVAVSSENDELLCVERSAAVDSAVGWWTVGVFETMKQSDPNRPGASEDLYGLAARGLNEELGLQPNDYNSIQISWIGILRPILRGHVVAVLKLKISKEEVNARVRAAHSGYEHAVLGWIPLRPATVQMFNQAARIMRPGKVGSTIEVYGRTWIEQSRLAVQEAWRFRNSIEN